MAKGDYTQTVSYLGEFSKAFNTMTPRLPGAGNALPRQFFVPACTLFLPRANGIIKLERRKITMKLIRTVDAAGQVLCHDITQIIPGEFKGPRFRKGHIVQPEDIPVLLSIGKENLYVWEKRPGILHEDEAAALLYKAAAGKNIHGTEPKEGKIELIADCDGLLKIDRAALLAVNRTPQMMIATIHGDMPVKKGQKLAGTRIIPLVIEQEKMDAMQAAADDDVLASSLKLMDRNKHVYEELAK